MRALVAYFVDRPLLVNLITVFVLVAGIIVATGMPRALLPSGRIGEVAVTAILPSASAVDVERFVTFRLEEALEGLEGIKELTSTTTNGRTELSLKLDPEVDDIADVMEEARSRLSAIRHLLPEDMRPLEVEEVAAEQTVLGILVKNIDESNLEHRRAVEALADRLRRLPNVIAVPSSMRDLHLYVRFDKQKLDRAGVSVTQVRQRILEYLGHMPVGGIRVRDEEVAVELAKPLESIGDLARLPLVVNRAGRGVTLGEVAEVRRGFAEELSRQTVEGTPYIEIGVTVAANSDSITVSEQVREVLDSDAGKLPEPMTVRMGGDATEIIAHELETLQGNGIGGIILVLLILMLFLGWRVSSMTALGLPFCYLGVVLVLQAFDMNFNLVSLVAMILVIGILVDDAIIVSEEFSQGLARGESAREAAINGVMRVGKPIMGMAATTSVAFMPLILMQGPVSWMLKPLPIVIVAALALSLFESFLILPNHLTHLMPSGTQAVERRFVAAMRRGYQRLLGWVLRLRYLSLLAVAGLALLTVVLLSGPVKVQGSLSLLGRAVIYVELDEPAESLERLAERIAPIEALVETLPQELCERYQTTLGTAFALRSDDMLRGWRYAQIEIYPPGSFVEQEEKRQIIAGRLSDELAELQKDGFSKLGFHITSTGDVRDVVTVYVSGGDRIEFVDIQDDIRAALGEIENVKDVFMDVARFQRSLRFVVDQKAILAYGLTDGQVHAELREAFSRQELVRLRHGGEEIEVFLGYTDTPQADREALAGLTVMTPGAVAVPLRYLGTWEETEVLRRIEHKDTLRMFQVDVLYDEDQVDAEAIAGAIEEQLEPVRAKYPGYYVSVKPSEHEAESRAWMLRLVLICVALVYLCLALSLGSLVQPLVVIVAIPFGFVGVVLAFWVHGMPLGVMAIIGLLGLAGVVVNDSLVLAATINDAFREQGDADLKAAVVAGAGRRFRAVVLTSLTTLGGVFPLAYGFAGRAGWLQPMVMAVGWGLLFATLLTLLFVPCLLLIAGDLQRLGGWVLRSLRIRGSS